MASASKVVRLTRELVDIPSISGDEGRVTRYLADHLSHLRYRVDLQEVAPGRANLFASAGSRARVVFTTHLDTVAPFIPSREDVTYVHGRGACDAKGIAAAQIAAAERLRALGCDEVGLLFVVDEEAGSLGAKAANHHPAAERCEYLICGEPTGNVLGSGSKGSMRVRLRASGRAAHSAYPRLGDSAIESLLDVLSLVRAHPWPGDPFFGETTCNIGTIRGGTQSNVVAAEAEAELHFRLATRSTEISDRLERLAVGRVAIEYLSVTEPEVFHTVEDVPRAMMFFTTDAPHLSNWGARLLLGPGSILDAHTRHERVAKRELGRAVEAYVQVARSLIGGGARGARV